MANTYHPTDLSVNATPIPVSGRWFAHNRHSQIERAFDAVDLHVGATQLVGPTLAQSARLARASYPYAWWAEQRQAERVAIVAGDVPLVPPRLIVPTRANGKTMSTLPASLDSPIDAWSLAKGLVETFGPAVVFDTVIAPAIA